MPRKSNKKEKKRSKRNASESSRSNNNNSNRSNDGDKGNDESLSSRRETLTEAISSQGFDRFLTTEFPRTSSGETMFLSKDAPLPNFDEPSFSANGPSRHLTKRQPPEAKSRELSVDRNKGSLSDLDKKLFFPQSDLALKDAKIPSDAPSTIAHDIQAVAVSATERVQHTGGTSCRKGLPHTCIKPKLPTVFSGRLMFLRTSQRLANFICTYQRYYLERDETQKEHLPTSSDTIVAAMARRFVVVQELRKKLVMRELVQRSKSLKCSQDTYRGVTQELLKIFLMNELSAIFASKRAHQEKCETVARELVRKFVIRDFMQRYQALKRSQEATRKVLQELLKQAVVSELSKMSASKREHHEKSGTVIQELAWKFVLREVVKRSKTLQESKKDYRGVIQELMKCSVVNELRKLSASKRDHHEKAGTVVRELVRKFVMQDVVERWKSLKQSQGAYKAVIQEILKLSVLNELCRSSTTMCQEETQRRRLSCAKRYTKGMVQIRAACF